MVTGMYSGYNSSGLKMTSIIQKFLIAAAVYLVAGLLAQTVTVFDVWLGFNPLAYTAVAATTQLLLIGWLTQLGLALVYARWQPEPDSLKNAVFILLNAGLPMTVLGQPGLALFGGHALGAVAAFGSLLQLSAGILFVYSLWKTFLNNSNNP